MEILAKCFLVYKELGAGPGRKPFSPNGEQLPVWTEPVKAKGFGKNTLARHFLKLGWIEREERTPALPAHRAGRRPHSSGERG